MSYFYLPKNNNNFLFDLQSCNIKIRGNDDKYRLNSMNFYKSLLNTIQYKNTEFDNLTKEIEPYKHIFNTVNTMNTNILYVSKYISLHESFFVMIELNQLLKIM